MRASLRALLLATPRAVPSLHIHGSRPDTHAPLRTLAASAGGAGLRDAHGAMAALTHQVRGYAKGGRRRGGMSMAPAPVRRNPNARIQRTVVRGY